MLDYRVEEKNYKADQLMEQFKNFEISEDIVIRELRLIGFTEQEIQIAIGNTTLLKG